MRRLILTAAFATATFLTGLTSVAANHDHNLITPGTTVVDIANGQTEKCATDPGGHQFHTHVHLGMPGIFAFAQPNNPVSIVKTESATC
jgi:hypothetical protein